jgi:four helix bundle protein
MMKIEGFEDLVVWRSVRDLANRAYALTRKGEFSEDRALMYQIRKAVISAMSNIAEGFERGSNKEFVQFLFISKGSCGEVRTQLAVAFDQEYIDKSEYEETCNLARRTSGTIGRLIKYLAGSQMKGSKAKMQLDRQMAPRL